MHRTRGAVGVAALALLLAGCGGGSSSAPHAGGTTGASRTTGQHAASYQPTARDLRDIKGLLRSQAHAVLHHDRSAFMATVDHSSAALVRTESTLYANLADLPLRRLSYAVDTSTLLVPAAVAGDAAALRPQVVEHLQLAGTMARPVGNTLDRTFVRRDGHWLLGAESLPTEEGSFDSPQERPWFGARIAVRRIGPLTVLEDADHAAQLPELARTVHDDIGHDAGILGVPPQYAVLVDASSNGTSHTMTPGGSGEAAAITNVMVATKGSDTRYSGVAGTFIKINPADVSQVLGDPSVLRHELTHYLLRRYSGSSPTWLVEGVAAWVQYYPDDFARLQIPAATYRKIMSADRALPLLGLFYEDSAVNYPIGQAAVAWLVDHGGTSRLLALMRAYRSAYDGANVDAHTPALLRRVYGVSQQQVVAGTWALLGQFQH